MEFVLNAAAAVNFPKYSISKALSIIPLSHVIIKLIRKDFEFYVCEMFEIYSWSSAL